MESDDIIIQDELKESVPFILLEELTRSRKITGVDGDFLRKKYGIMYMMVKQCQTIEQALMKRIRIVSNEVLSEKINLEKSKTTELESSRNVKKLELERDEHLQILEEIAEKDSNGRFDLAELKKLHDDLTVQAESIMKENRGIVEPVLERLRQEIIKAGDMQEAADVTLQKEGAEKQTVVKKLEEVEATLHMRKEILNDLLVQAQETQPQPIRLKKKTENMKHAISNMETDLERLNESIKRKDIDIEKHHRKKEEAAKLKAHLEEQVDLHHQTLHTRHAEISVLKSEVETMQAAQHDLITEKVALNIKRREAESAVRYRDDQLNFVQREYEGHKRLYKKKVSIVDLLRQCIPDLEVQLQDAEIAVKQYTRESESRSKRIGELKDAQEEAVCKFLEQGGIEKDVKKELENAMTEVEDLDAEIARLMAEERRLTKLSALLSQQRDASIAQAYVVDHKQKEARNLIRMKELIILDHTKRCAEISTRLKEFSGLYEIVKNERNKFSSTILSSSQALAEMREKIRILEREIDILQAESNGKSAALQKEKNAIMVSIAHRDQLRKEMNVYLSEYRVKQRQIELQIQQIEKENTFLNAVEKSMISAKASYEKAVAERNAAGVQLINRNDEICVVQERWRQLQETLSRGDEELQKKEEELRMLRLQSEELRRAYRSAKARVPEVELLKNKLHALEQELLEQRRVLHEYGDKLEDPKNSERWRGLEGEDPGFDVLSDKVSALEKRIDFKREQLLERDLVLVEISTVTDKLRSQALVRRKVAGNMADQLCDLKNRIKEITTKMLASVSELSMYQATALRLQEEKVLRKQELEDVIFRVEHGEPPTEDAVRELARSERRRMQAAEATARRQNELKMHASPADMKKTTAEPRPTAYIPEDMFIPKPYGNSAPFKPMDSSNVGRHMRQPQPKLIEI